MADAQKTVAIIFEGDASQAITSIRGIDAALDQVDKAEAFRKLNTELQSGERSLLVFDLALRQIIASNGTAAEKAEAFRLITGNTKLTVEECTAALNKLESQYKENEAANEQSGEALKKFQRSQEETKITTDSLVTALKAFAASIVFREFVEANANAEQFRKTMEAVTGDSQAAAREFDYIRNVSNRMGLEVLSASTSFAALAAATKGTALEGDGARVIFEAVAGTMAALGRSSADTDRALVQVRQGISKGKFELEDLKSIAEVIPGFFDQFAKSLGVTTEDLFRLIGQGQIGTKEFLTFANTLNDSLGSGKFDGYQQNLNRLKNSITDAFVVIGDAGAWQVFNAAINTATVSITGAVGFVKLLGETLGNLAFTIANGDWTGFGDRFDESLQKVAPAMQRTTDALLGISDNAKTAGFNAAEAGKAIADGMQAAAFSAEDFLKKFDTALRSVTSSESLAQITTDLVIAFSKGDIAAGDFYTRLDDVQKKQLELDKAMGGATTALLEQETQFKKTTKQTEDAEKAANAYALKMAEIASNENIKLIQSKVSLDIAEVEANAKITVAAFESINTAIDSTGKTLTDMLGLLDSSQDWTTFNFLRGEIEKESKRRDDALKLQAEYIQAQIANLNAKTQAMQDGDALITIDGAGLQPHLEAFMWEILRTIQVRVNADGLEMLVGV